VRYARRVRARRAVLAVTPLLAVASMLLGAGGAGAQNSTPWRPPLPFPGDGANPWACRVVDTYHREESVARYTLGADGRPVGVETTNPPRSRGRVEQAAFVWDGAARRLTERRPGSEEPDRTWVFDESGRVVERADYSRGALLLRRDAFAYDAAGRLVLHDDEQPEGTPPLSRWTYEYDAAGRLVRVLASVPPAPADAVTELTWTEDRRGAVAVTRDPSDGHVVYRHELRYDEDGRLVEEVQENHAGERSRIEWTYDADGRVASYDDGTRITLRYDAAGRIASRQDDFGRDGSVEVSWVFEYECDEEAGGP
jgi:YD repeat-containing protein